MKVLQLSVGVKQAHRKLCELYHEKVPYQDLPWPSLESTSESSKAYNQESIENDEEKESKISKESTKINHEMIVSSFKPYYKG